MWWSLMPLRVAYVHEVVTHHLRPVVHADVVWGSVPIDQPVQGPDQSGRRYRDAAPMHSASQLASSITFSVRNLRPS